MMLETKQEALDKGWRRSARITKTRCARATLNEASLERRVALITGTLDYDDICATPIIVIEAVFERHGA